MKVQGPRPPIGPAASRPTGGSKRAFSLDRAEDVGETAEAAETSAPEALLPAFVDLLEGDAEDRKRKFSYDQGASALKALQGLQLCLLDGSLDERVAARLVACIEEMRGTTGDDSLEGTLLEVQERLEVELAKLQASANG